MDCMCLRCQRRARRKWLANAPLARALVDGHTCVVDDGLILRRLRVDSLPDMRPPSASLPTDPLTFLN